MFTPKKDLAGQRGKKAEATVQKVLEKFDAANSRFDWLRLPDAHSAGGRMKSMPGDFEYFMQDAHGAVAHGIIEVKELAHDYRLPKDKVKQLPRIAKRDNAGGLSFILVNHTTQGTWRILKPEQLPPGFPSWDLSERKEWGSAEEALRSEGVFRWLK